MKKKEVAMAKVKAKNKKAKPTRVSKKTGAKGIKKSKNLSLKKASIQAGSVAAKQKKSVTSSKKAKQSSSVKKKALATKPLKKVVTKKIAPQVKLKSKVQASSKSNKLQSVTKKSNLKESLLSKVISPLDDRVFVRLMPEVSQTSGGLFIPSQAQGESFQKGEVLSVGRGHQDKKGRIKPLDIKVGDSIVFQKIRGHLIDWQGESHCLIRESDILGIIESLGDGSYGKGTAKK